MQNTSPALAPKPVGRQRKFDRLCVQLRELAHRLGPEAKLPTMVQLRDTLGVSVATLSSALGELEADNVIYRRHGIGIFVSPRLRQKAICLICDPDFFRGGSTSPFWDLLVDQARRRAAARDEAFSFHLAQPDGHSGSVLQEGLMAEIQAGRVDGVLCLGLDRTAADWLEAQGVPTVVFAGSSRWTVNLDGEEGIRLAVAELSALGGQQVGYWGPARLPKPTEALPPEPSSAVQAFRQALITHGLFFDPRYVRENRDRPSLTRQEQGYLTAMEVFGGDISCRPDALYIGDDLMTQGALPALQKLGVRPGHNLRLATHANAGSPVLLGQEEALALIEVDPAEVVSQMFAMLEPLMEHRVPPQASVKIKPKVRLPATPPAIASGDRTS